MTVIDSDIGFDAVFRKSAAELKLRLTRDAESTSTSQPTQRRGGYAVYSVFGGLALLSLGILTIGWSAISSDSPEIWIHRLMALALLQSILIAAVTMKLLPIIERRRSVISIGRHPELPSQTPKPTDPRTERIPPPLPQPPKPVVGGQLAGREFLEYNDGSVEIDTMVGRRRFVSLAAAREFVGS
jgi:hypothetical protein